MYTLSRVSSYVNICDPSREKGHYGNFEKHQSCSACAVRADWPRSNLFAIGRFFCVLNDNSSLLNCHFKNYRLESTYSCFIPHFLFISFRRSFDKVPFHMIGHTHTHTHTHIERERERERESIHVLMTMMIHY